MATSVHTVFVATESPRERRKPQELQRRPGVYVAERPSAEETWIWVSDAVHYFGYSAFRCQSSFCWRCSGV